MNNESLLSLSISETKYVFIPSWFLYEYEISLASQTTKNARLHQQNQIFPKLQLQDFDVLLVLLFKIQQLQLASGGISERLILDPHSLAAEFAHYNFSAEEIVRVVTVFSTFRTVDFSNVKSIPNLIFKSELWELPQGKRVPLLHLEQGEYTDEFVSGLVDAHIGHLRMQSSRANLYFSFPVQVDIDLWMKLTSQERVVWMRLMKSFSPQQSANVNHRALSVTLDELTKNLDLLQDSFDDQNLLMKQLRLIGGLGRKLSAENFVTGVLDASSIDLRAHQSNEAINLVWHPNINERFLGFEITYYSAMSQKILLNLVTRNINSIIDAFVDLTTSRTSQELLDIWVAIRNVPGMSIKLCNGALAQIHLLFMEWICRADESSRYPISSHLDSSVIAICRNTNKSNAVAQFKHFKSAFEKQSPSIKSFLISTCNENPFSIAELQLINCSRSPKDYQRASKPNETLKSALIDKLEMQNLIEKNKSALPANRISVKQESLDLFKIGVSEHKMKQIAQEELEKMMRHSPSSYANLKSSFLASLDSETKSLVMDVERRLDSKAFDRHLKMRLVRYMTDFPSSWKSISPPVKM